MRYFILASLLVVLGYASQLTAADPPPYKDPDLKPADREHWSFISPKRPALPTLAPPYQWLAHPIDRFVIAKLQAKGLKPAPEADRLTLIRRVTFDLTGLPPTPAEIDAFLHDKSAEAYAKLVDRLLASPHYGERWAQHWLDVVRFAETNGFEVDGDRPQAWRYRDYVVRSFNANKPYDRFITEQLAGDLLAAGKDPRDVADLWLATGLHRCGQVHMVSGNVDKEEGRQEVLLEMVNGVSSAILGLTIGCARCHDHKFDPVSLGDYYRLQAFFGATQFKDVDLGSDAEKEKLQKQLLSVTLKMAPLKKQIAEIEAPYRAKLHAERKAKLDEKTRAAVDTDAKKRSDEQKKLVAAVAPDLKIMWDEVLDVLTDADRKKRQAIRDQLSEVERELPELPPQAWAIADEKTVPVMHILRRGDVKRKSGPATPAFPRVVSSGETPKTRLDLAKWLTAKDHPLTARVIVNRLWLHHFGRGIVNTPNDFGTRGDRPTHPELLDWLASELIEPTVAKGEPWALKRLHKLMVTSATYKQTSTPRADDAENAYFSRMNRRRLDAEGIRDAMLTAAGTLTRDVGGVSVKVPLEPEVYDLIFTEGEPAGLWPVTRDVKQHTRRSLYLFLKRNVRLPMLEAFDQPDTINSCAARPVSTFAPQALILMNGPLAQEQSKAFAADLLRTAGADPTVQVTALYRRALGRFPRDAELNASLAFLKEQTELLRPKLKDDAATRSLADLCLALFNTNEFVYIP